MHRALLQGCTEEERLKTVSMKYAKNYLFKQKFDALARNRNVEGYNNLEEEIRMFVSCNILDMIRWARRGGEDTGEIDLNEVRRRYAMQLQERRRREKRIALQSEMKSF